MWPWPAGGYQHTPRPCGERMRAFAVPCDARGRHGRTRRRCLAERPARRSPCGGIWRVLREPCHRLASPVRRKALRRDASSRLQGHSLAHGGINEGLECQIEAQPPAALTGRHSCHCMTTVCRKPRGPRGFRHTRTSGRRLRHGRAVDACTHGDKRRVSYTHKRCFLDIGHCNFKRRPRRRLRWLKLQALRPARLPPFAAHSLAARQGDRFACGVIDRFTLH